MAPPVPKTTTGSGRLSMAAGELALAHHGVLVQPEHLVRRGLDLLKVRLQPLEVGAARRLVAADGEEDLVAPLVAVPGHPQAPRRLRLAGLGEVLLLQVQL